MMTCPACGSVVNRMLPPDAVLMVPCMHWSGRVILRPVVAAVYACSGCDAVTSTNALTLRPRP